MPQYCFLDVAIGDGEPRRVGLELFTEAAPKTCENFAKLCAGNGGEKVPGTEVPMSYEGSIFHRVIPRFMLQGGDYTNFDGTGGHSIYGPEFDDEEFELTCDKPGLLCMANRGPNTNGSQFFVTTAAAEHLNGKHVVFGKVVTGMNVVRAVESTPTGANDRPVADCKVVRCGILDAKPEEPAPADGDTLADYPEDAPEPLNDETALEAGEKVRQMGNGHFGGGRFAEAIVKYAKAVRYLEVVVPTSANEADLRTKRVACQSNTALCHIKLEQWGKARAAANAALALESDNAKALFRRATASQMLNDMEEAKADYTRVLAGDENNADVKARLAEVDALIAQRKDKMKAQYKKMFA